MIFENDFNESVLFWCEYHTIQSGAGTHSHTSSATADAGAEPEAFLRGSGRERARAVLFRADLICKKDRAARVHVNQTEFHLAASGSVSRVLRAYSLWSGAVRRQTRAHRFRGSWVTLWA